MVSVDHGRFAALRRISAVASVRPSVARSFPVPSSKSACSCRPQLNVFRHDARTPTPRCQYNMRQPMDAVQFVASFSKLPREPLLVARAHLIFTSCHFNFEQEEIGTHKKLDIIS